MANELTREIIIRGRADLTQMQGELAKVENNFKSSFGRLESTSKAASASLQPLARSISSLVGAAGPLGNALGNIITSFGPMALAVGGVTFAISALTRAWSASRQAAEDFKRSMEDQDKTIFDLNLEYQLLTKQIDEAEAATRRLHRSQEALAIQAKRAQVEQLRALVEDPSRKGFDALKKELGINQLGLATLLERRTRELAEQEAKFNAVVAGTVRNIRARQKQVIPKKERDDVEQFIRKLASDLSRLEQKRVEITIGTDAALDLRLTQELDALKEKLGGKLISEENLARIQELADKMRDADREVRQITESLKALEHLDFEDMERGAKAMGEMERAAGKNAEALRRQVTELQKTMGMEVLPPEDQAQARIRAELQERLKLIQDWVEAQRASGRDVELINAQAAEATAQAWESAYKKMSERADEFTEFQKRAFHRMHDAMADITRDALGGQIKSWQDLHDRISRVMSSIASEFIALELKTGLFGEEFGKPGAKAGGLVGWIMGNDSKRTEGPLSSMGGAFDTEEKIWGEMAQQGIAAIDAGSTAAIAAIEATAMAVQGTATAAIQAESATAQAMFQTEATIAQGSIQAVQAAATTSIQAMQHTAIAAIQAAAAGSGAADAAGALGGGGGVSWASLISVAVAHTGGRIGAPGMATRQVDAIAFASAPRLHAGGVAGIRPNEVPAILQKGEWVLTEKQMAALANNLRGGGDRMEREGNKNEFHFHGVDNMDSFRRSRPQLLSDLTRAVEKGRKHL